MFESTYFFLKNVSANIVQDFARNVENNATILAYGQTGAGKTFTMLGNKKEKGIIQRSLEDIFRICDPETDSIGIAFYEIHNEKVFDLLSQSALKGLFCVLRNHHNFKKIYFYLHIKIRNGVDHH